MQLQLEKDPSLKRPQKTFFVLFGLLFLIAPFYYQPNLGGEGLYLPYNSSIWLVASWIIAAGCFLIYHSKRLILPKYWLGLALLPIGTIITGFIVENSNPTEWVVRVSVITGGYLLFIALFQFRLNHRHVERSLYILVAMGLIAATYGIIQIHGEIQRSNIFPISPNHSPVGIFQQVNLQASMMATLLVLVFYLVSRPALQSFGFIVKITLCLTAFAASYTIAMSGSRVGLLGAFVGLSLLFIGRSKLFKTSKTWLVMLILATILGGTAGSAGLSKTAYKFDRAMGGMEADVRWKVYQLSWQLFLEAPVLGHGIGSFQKAFQEKRAEAQQENQLSLGLSPRFTHPHNEIMFWLVEGGVIAVIGILAASVFTFLQLKRAGRQRGFAYAALLVPIVLHSQVELPFYISNTHWFILLILLFVINQHEMKTISLNSLSLSAQKLIPLCCIVLSLTLSYTVIKAQTANAGIVNYLMRQQSQPAYLQSSLNMWYFREYTTYLLLQRNLRAVDEQARKEAAKAFITWANESLKVSPALQIYRDQAAAYDILDDKKKRDETLATAAMIYENNPTLLKAQRYFAKKHADDSAAMTTPEVTNAASMSQDQKQANP